jgi:hypothetical protein
MLSSRTLLTVIFVLGLAVTSSASVEFPRSLTSSDRAQLTRLLGVGTSSKVLSDPFPLGGFDGVEVGIQTESIPTDELSQLGTKTQRQDRFSYPRFSIGKGIYHHMDTFLHFVPFQQSTGLTEYGGILRWGFYQGLDLPATLSINTFANSTNIRDLFIARNIGAELIAGLTLRDFSLYMGIGNVWSTGRFAGGNTQLTDTRSTEDSSVSAVTTQLGFVYHLRPLFLAVQINNYSVAVLSAKLGTRF